MIAEKEKLRLNLGSRDRSLAGFKNIDIDWHEGVDYKCDAGNISSIFTAASVAEIYASHILEHFPHTMTLEVLRDWHKVLEPGGILYVAVPDFKRTVEIYLQTGLQDWIVNYLWGDQLYQTAYHYAGFDEERIKKLLTEAGFTEISRVERFPYNKKDCSNNISTLDRKSVSLNMVARKGE